MNTKIKRKTIKWIILGIVLLILISISTILYINSYYIYILGEYFGVNCEKIEINKVYPEDIVQFTLDELSSNDKIEFNQSMMLINTDFPLKNDFVPIISQYKDTDVKMNNCMHDAYTSLSAAVTENTGEKIFISSDYRTDSQQQEEYNENPSSATKPGASEHQSGLALDIYSPYYAGFSFIKTEAGKFVNSNCWKYGFIIRYPSFGKNETGIKYEPWHIRYVGEPHAKIIYNNHLTLEDYILYYENDVWYEIDGYLISRQTLSSNNTLKIPKDYSEVVISPDNTGYYIVTVLKNK